MGGLCGAWLCGERHRPSPHGPRCEIGATGPHRMKYSPTYKVVWMVGPRKGQNFFSRLTLRDLALCSWASRSYGEVASPSEAWREADMAACAAVSLSLPGRHRSSQLYRDEQRRGHDRPSLRRESQPRSTVLIKTISRQKCQHCSAACESPRAYSTTVHGVLC